MAETVLFSQGFNCAQSVFAEAALRMGVSRELALKIAAAFGGGMSSHGEVCGAVSGALMALGLRFASPDPDDKERRDFVYSRGRDFMQRFESQHGSLICRQLLGRDLNQPGELEQARSEDRFNAICPAYIASAAAILGDLLD
jgi:C_GCAxxG_C_C family probable redox protein